MSENRTDYKMFIIFSRIHLHEIFIETIAMLFKCRNYIAINAITSIPYYDYFSNKNELSYFQNIFYSLSKDHIYEICDFLSVFLRQSPNNGPYYSGIAEYWKRHMPIKYINLYEFANADCLLTNIAISINNDYWFACSYVYLPDNESSFIKEIATSLKSKKYYILFDFNNINDIKNLLEIMEKYSTELNYLIGYPGSFYTIPLLTDIIKETDLEST